jgi:Domain of unknown function (DUF4403)
MKFCLYPIMFSTLLVSACKNSSTAPAAPCDDQSLEIPMDTSFLSTALVIPTQLIEDKLNSAVRRDILNDFDGNKVGKTKLKVTRLGLITVQWKDNVATYQAPLLVLVEQQIVPKKILPLPRSLAIKTEFSLQLVFETTLHIGPDWKLQPKTKFVSFKWLSEVKALGGLINLKKIVERRLRRQMPTILNNMDEEIRTKVHLDRGMTRVWRKIQKPIRINRNSEVVWLKINPIRFEVGKIKSKADSLYVQGRLSATTETLFGDNPQYSIDSTLPLLVKRSKLPNDAYLYMLSEIPISDISDIVHHKLGGKTFEILGRQLKVKQADLCGCGSNLVLHLNLSGDMKGDIYLQGKPHYDADSQRIVIHNFDFEVKTQEVLLASADWLLHSSFKQQIEAVLNVELAGQIAKIPDAITQGIEKGRAGKKMDFSIEHWDFRPQQIWVRPTNIATLIIVNARVRIELEKI